MVRKRKKKNWTVAFELKKVGECGRNRSGIGKRAMPVYLVTYIC